ncbi:beta-defensin 104A-like [Capricornis sumatraensis]|uniref:beta-defensin 104A-like n=1 Tax=Capricornis sumatraensis TaxID=34865 RepID=UPI0036044134
MRILVLLLPLSFCSPKLLQVKRDSQLDRICGYGTARCRRNCKRQEFRVGKCPNTYPCCLKKWNVNSLNPQKDGKPKGAWLLEMAASQTSEPPFSGPSRWTVPSGTSRLVE